MIDQTHESDDTLQRYIIRPNRAMSWQGLMIFFLTISTVTLGIGVWFFVKGFPLILPFSGIELMLLAYALYTTAWCAAAKQVISINDETVTVETGHRLLEKSYRFQRPWTRVTLERPEHSWYPSRLLIRSQGKQLEIGGFLNEEERQGLAEKLSTALS